jgi:hypothetical protein
MRPDLLSAPDVERIEQPDFSQGTLTGTRRRRLRFSRSRRGLTIHVEGEPAEWLRSALATLRRILNLPANWDSYGAPPIQGELVEPVLQFLDSVMSDSMPVPAIVPTSSGGIQLEWHTRGVDLEIEFTPSGLVHVYYLDHAADEEWEGDLESLRPQVDQAFQRLCR